LIFSTTFSETFPILRNTHHDTIINVHGYSREVLVTLFLSYFNKTIIFSQVFGNPHVSNFMKIRPVGAELLHEGGRTEGHGGANSRFSQISQRVKEQDAFE
jgi:hypothetical protein